MSEFKKILPFFALAIAVILVGGLLNRGVLKTPTSNTNSKNEKFVLIAGKQINVELANTEELRRKGLSGRDALEENSGMLFIFDSKDLRVAFWMKDTKITLDFIWINDGKVSQITQSVQPEPNTPDDQLKIYTPGAPIDYVLEVNAGFVQKNNIKVGDSVDLSEATRD